MAKIKKNVFLCFGKRVHLPSHEGEISMAVCSNCGKEIDSGAKFCPNCGSAVNNSSFRNDCDVEMNISVKVNGTIDSVTDNKDFVPHLGG